MLVHPGQNESADHEEQYHHGDTGPLGIKDLGKKAKEYMNEGKLVPDQLVIDMVDDKLQESGDIKGIIFDGFKDIKIAIQIKV